MRHGVCLCGSRAIRGEMRSQDIQTQNQHPPDDAAPSSVARNAVGQTPHRATRQLTKKKKKKKKKKEIPFLARFYHSIS
jgi:hypothetical protein